MLRASALLVLLLSSTSYAQPAGAQAEVLFRQGRELMAAGKTAEACESFEQSQKLEPAVTTLMNLAACREKNGQVATAWGLFLEAERQTRGGADATAQQLHGVAQKRATALEPRVSKLTINVPAASTLNGLEILRGTERVESIMWNRALPIDGGNYTITARAPGVRAWQAKITIANDGDVKSVTIPDLRTPEPAPAPVKSAPSPSSGSPVTTVTPPLPETTVTKPQPEMTAPAPEGTPSRSKLVPVAMGIGAVALLGGGLGFELWGRGIYDDAKAEMTDQERRNSLYDSANTKHYVAQGMAIAGIGCAGVAVWLYLRGGSVPATQTARTRELVVSPTGIALVGSF
jgi:hypothetical protein